MSQPQPEPRSSWTLPVVAIGCGVGLVAIYWLGNGSRTAPERIGVTGTIAATPAPMPKESPAVPVSVVVVPDALPASAPAQMRRTPGAPTGLPEPGGVEAPFALPSIGPDPVPQLAQILRSDPVALNRLHAIDELRLRGMQGDAGDRIRDALQAAARDADPAVAISARDALSVLLD